MLNFFDRITAHDVGVVIGLFIVFFFIKFLWFLGIMVLAGVEKIIMKVLEGTALENPANKFFLRLGNLVTRFKWSDPEKDLYGSFDRMIDAMHDGTWDKDLQKKLDKQDSRRLMWDNIRSQIVWITVFILIVLYAKPWS